MAAPILLSVEIWLVVSHHQLVKIFMAHMMPRIFAKKCADELMMQTVPSKNLVYTKEKGYISAEEAKEFNYEIMKLSGTEFRKKLRNGEPIPEWFAFKSVVDVLRRS